MEISNITRESVALRLVEKHKKALEVVSEEFERYSAQEKELDGAAGQYKTNRDRLNDEVQKLKDFRQNYYSESRELRKEFMSQMQKKKAMADIPMEVMILTKQIDQLEWEIQTEAVSIDEEKKLVKNIQDSLEKLHNYANMYKEHEIVGSAVKTLSSELNNKLKNARTKHDEMLRSVAESDDYHKKFVEAMVKLRDARSKRIGFQHEMDKHKKGVEHWQSVYQKEVKTNKSAKSKADKDPKPGSTSKPARPVPEPKHGTGPELGNEQAAQPKGPAKAKEDKEEKKDKKPLDKSPDKKDQKQNGNEVTSTKEVA